MSRRVVQAMAACLAAGLGLAAGAAPIPFVAASVEATGAHAVTIRWRAPGVRSVTVYAGTAAGAVGRTRRIGRGAGVGVLVARALPDAPRWYFELVPDRGASLTVADRSLYLASAPNFRDAGGYRTADGRWVRSGLLYRSDRLDLLSDADLARLGALAPALIVDLRTERERRRGLDRRPDGTEHLIADVYADAELPSGADPLDEIHSPAEAVELMTRANRLFVTMASARASYATLFQRIGAAQQPVVYHCTSGKDRTGWASAVLLTVLGVPREVVVEDYLASNAYLRLKNREREARLGERGALIDPVFWVRAEYLEAAFAEVDAHYGSFDRYVEDALGLDAAAIAALRARLLTGDPVP